MDIRNLDINILYFMCNPLNGRHQDGMSDTRDIAYEFSDIPAGRVIATIQSMAAKGLITIDRSASQVAITADGINRLQSSIACRIHRSDRCGCGKKT